MVVDIHICGGVGLGLIQCTLTSLITFAGRWVYTYIKTPCAHPNTKTRTVP